MTPSERSANRPGDFRAWIWVAGAAGALAAAVLLTPAPLWLAYMAILALGWGLPGLLLAWLWELPGVDLPAFLLVAFGLGLGWLIAGALLIHHFPGPIAGWANPAVYGAGAVVLLTIAARRSPRLPALGDAQMWRWGLILLALTALLRLPGLGYHEFHADEAVLLRQAGRAVSGQDDAVSTKSIAVTLAIYRRWAQPTRRRGCPSRDERGERAGYGLLGRRLFSPQAGCGPASYWRRTALPWVCRALPSISPRCCFFRRWPCGRCGSSRSGARGVGWRSPRRGALWA